MTLLIMVFASVISTVVWYLTVQKIDLKLGTLCLLYWGASVMWFADALFEYAELKSQYFMPETADMINDGFLGLAVVALGLVIWVVRLLIADPKGVIADMLFKKTTKKEKQEGDIL